MRRTVLRRRAIGERVRTPRGVGVVAWRMNHLYHVNFTVGPAFSGWYDAGELRSA